MNQNYLPMLMALLRQRGHQKRGYGTALARPMPTGGGIQQMLGGLQSWGQSYPLESIGPLGGIGGSAPGYPLAALGALGGFDPGAVGIADPATRRGKRPSRPSAPSMATY